MPKTTFIHKENGKRWKLPIKIGKAMSVQQNTYSYSVVGYREPKKGELYISGSIAEYYKAPNDLSNKFIIIEIKKVVL